MPVSGVLALILLALIAGVFVYGAFLAPEPVDVDALYCEASADGWRAAHIRLYDYIEQTNAEYFARAFQPMTPGGREVLVESCLKDPVGIRKTLADVLEQG
jgi:hypothetical protein